MPNGKKVVSLLSDGLDSPVSTYLMMKQGYDVLAVSMITAHDPQNLSRNKVLKLAKLLKEKTGRNIEVHFVKYTEIQGEFVEKAERKLTCLLCKRLMLRIAQEIAKREGIDYIINGDILGEQASQTLENLYAVQRVVSDALVIRPLIGFDKIEVIRIAQQIGTYEICSEKAPSCDRNPKYPETHARLKDLVKAETPFDYNFIVKSLINGIEIVKI